MAEHRPQIKLGAFLFMPGNHRAGWLHPDAWPESGISFAQHMALAQTAERGLMDTIFFQDSAAVPHSKAIESGESFMESVARIAFLEPASVLPALAVVTKNIGLIATATTTYNEPYNVARRFATIDHISGGRAGWNLVTSQVEEEALNFNLDKHVEHATRYVRAAEFYEVVTGLWDSWEEDAFVMNKQTRQFFDRSKVHFLNHKGDNFSVRGPLNVPRTPQGRPIVAQAGSSDVGKELAARTADLVFTAQVEIEEAQEFYRDVKGRLAKYGREPGDVKIMPGFMPIVAATDAEAWEKYEYLQSLLGNNIEIVAIQRHVPNIKLSEYDLDGPFPDLPESNLAKGRQKHMLDLAKRNNWSIRQVARYFAGAGGHRIVIGSPKTIVDEMEQWVRGEAADGFNLIFPYFPTPLEEFVDLVVPEMQARGLYRTAYEGTTLRENLGLKPVRNRYDR